MWQNFKTKLWQNFKSLNEMKTKKFNYNKSQKLKLWQNSKPHIAKKNYDKTQAIKVWQNLTTQIVTTLNNSNCGTIKRPKLWEKKSVLSKLETENFTRLKKKKKLSRKKSISDKNVLG